MSRDEFTKRWDKVGFTWKEAVIKKAQVDEAHGVGTTKSKWAEAQIVDDPRGGYKVVISTI